MSKYLGVFITREIENYRRYQMSKMKNLILKKYQVYEVFECYVQRI